MWMRPAAGRMAAAPPPSPPKRPAAKRQLHWPSSGQFYVHWVSLLPSLSLKICTSCGAGIKTLAGCRSSSWSGTCLTLAATCFRCRDNIFFRAGSMPESRFHQGPQADGTRKPAIHAPIGAVAIPAFRLQLTTASWPWLHRTKNRTAAPGCRPIFFASQRHPPPSAPCG